jgi:hypothetical protein
MTEAARGALLRADARLDALLPRLIDVRVRKAQLEAEEARLLAEARSIADDWTTDSGGHSGSGAELAHRTIAAEIGAAWRVSDRTVQRQMHEAATLVGAYAATTTALEAGQISIAHARAITSAGTVIDKPELRAEYEQEILSFACAESATRLTPVAKRRAEWFAETTFEQRHRRCLADRTVWVTDLDDGMAEVRAVLPAVVAHGIHDRLSQMARTVIDARRPVTGSEMVDAGAQAQPDTEPIDTDAGAGAGADADADSDDRSTDQVRADIFADLMLAAHPVAHDGGPTGLGAIRASVQITVPVMSLIDQAVTDPYESPFLAGRSPVDATTACMLAAGAPGWDRILTHPISGQLLAVDRYRPSEQLRRHLVVRDQHCRFPGCRMPPHRCDADHTIDAAHGGCTGDDNLALLCRRHHILKHHSAWAVRQLPGGVLQWTSPTGRRYTDTPISRIAFAPDPECELEPVPVAPRVSQRLALTRSLVRTGVWCES